MRRVLVFVTGIILLGGSFLGGGCFLVIAVSQPCGWLDSYINYSGCIRQLDIGGVGHETFASDLTTFAADTVNGMRVWQMNDGQLLTEVPGRIGVFSPNGVFFVVSSTERISVWHTQGWTLQSTLDIDTKNVAQLAIAPDLNSLAVVLREYPTPGWQLQLWQTNDGTLLHKLEGHTNYISSVAYSPDGTKLASASWDKTVQLWRVEDGVRLKTLIGHTDNVEDVAFAPDGRTLASSSWDGTIRVWRTEDGTPLYTLKGGNRIAFDIAYSPNGSILASAGTAGLVQLWNVKDGTLIRNLRQNWRGIDIDALAFSPDGQVLATAQQDGSVRLYNVQKMLGTATD